MRPVSLLGMVRDAGWLAPALLLVALEAGCGGGEPSCPEGTVLEGSRCVVPGDGGRDGRSRPDGGEGCVPRPWYPDGDGDGFGTDDGVVMACDPPGADYSERGGDCDDACDRCFPGNAEACDGLDNDCSGAADDATDLCPDDDNPCTIDRCEAGRCGVPEHAWHPCGTDQVCSVSTASAGPAGDGGVDPDGGVPYREPVCVAIPTLRAQWTGRQASVDGRRGGLVLVRSRPTDRQGRLELLRLDESTGELRTVLEKTVSRTGNYVSWGDGGAALDRSGTSNDVVVGVPDYGTTNRASGRAAFYEDQGDGTWRGMLFDHGPSRTADRRLGTSVALWRPWVAVGAEEPDRSGAVILYERDGTGTWRARQRLRATSPAAGARFGGGVYFVDERTLLVSESGADGAGALHVFVRGDDGRWTAAQVLQAPVPQPGAGFGGFVVFPDSFAGDGESDAMVVSEPGRDVGTARDQGALYVLRRMPSGSWSVEPLPVEGLGDTEGMLFGTVRGDLAVVGIGPKWEPGAMGTKRVAVLRRMAAGTWRQRFVFDVFNPDEDVFPTPMPALLGDGLVVTGGLGVASAELHELRGDGPDEAVPIGRLGGPEGTLLGFPVAYVQGWLVMMGSNTGFDTDFLFTARPQ